MNNHIRATSRTLFFVALLLALAEFVSGQSPLPKAELIHRYERGCGLSCNQELAIDLGGVRGATSDDIIAVRLCSKEPLPEALAFAASPPGYVIEILCNYKYTSERILVLRSDDCIGRNPTVAATEYWVVHTGGKLPSAIESVKSCQLDLGSLGTRGASFREYRTALNNLPQALKSNSARFGVVLGYYIHRPSARMVKRMKEVRRFLERSGMPQDRYLVSLKPWTGEYAIEPPDPEPKYPDISIIEISKNCRGH